MITHLIARIFRRWAMPNTSVEFDDDAIRCIRPDGRVDSITWADLRLVAIETNDQGPLFEDLFFHLEGPECGFSIPQLADGASELAGRLTGLPGFDRGAYMTAMTSTDNAQFLCWRRGDA